VSSPRDLAAAAVERCKQGTFDLADVRKHQEDSTPHVACFYCIVETIESAAQEQAQPAEPLRRLACCWCAHEWDTPYAGSAYESCPDCRGSYSFKKPREVTA
jgi:hypothetical protein